MTRRICFGAAFRERNLFNKGLASNEWSDRCRAINPFSHRQIRVKIDARPEITLQMKKNGA
jgi:hypothetical protein